MIYLLVVLAFFIGYHLRELTEMMRLVLNKLDRIKIAKEDEPKSKIVEEITPAQLAQQQHEELMKQLNPERK